MKGFFSLLLKNFKIKVITLLNKIKLFCYNVDKVFEGRMRGWKDKAASLIPERIRKTELRGKEPSDGGRGINDLTYF